MSELPAPDANQILTITVGTVDGPIDVKFDPRHTLPLLNAVDRMQEMQALEEPPPGETFKRLRDVLVQFAAKDERERLGQLIDDGDIDITECNRVINQLAANATGADPTSPGS